MTSAPSNAPTFHDALVRFAGPTSSGDASVHFVSAGKPGSPAIILLHGYPSSSYQFRDFIPLLSDAYHVIAPDLPGFGLTTVPPDFDYTFENLAAVISAWISTLNLDRYALYIFDYGAPVGLQIAMANPGKVAAIVSQNGNAYEEGFGPDFWAPIFKLWDEGNPAAVRQLIQDNALTLAATKFQYVSGTPDQDLALLNPASWHFDYLQNIAGAASSKRQLDLFYDYRNNVKKYPAFQQYFRESKVPILAVWGKGDPCFIPAGAEAFRRDSPSAVVESVDAGHFALETKRWEIASIMRQWLTSIRYQ